MVCAKCNTYYPNSKKVCPYCGYAMTRAERKAYQDRLKAEIKSERKRKAAEKPRYPDWEKEDQFPVAAYLLDARVERGPGVVNTTIRGLVGGALLGSFGAAVGIATAKKKVSATFSVTYATGRKGTETVEVGSARYKKLIALL